jgi:hypothetical protein
LADAHRRRGVAKVEDLDPTSNWAVTEYLSVLDDAAFGGATPVEPKAISPTDPAARYTASSNSVAAYAYSDSGRHPRSGSSAAAGPRLGPGRRGARSPPSRRPRRPDRRRRRRARPPWRNVQPIDSPYARRIDAAHSGLVSPVLHETARAWKVQTRAGEPAWLPKSQVQHQGQDGGSASSSYCRPGWPGGSIWRPRHGQPAPAGCHFGVILADARWRLESWGPKGQRRSASRHYDVLTPTRGPPRAGFAREQSDDAEEPPAAPPQ